MSTQGTKQEEAALILKLYDMRREDEFRKAREWFDTEFDPQSAQDLIDLMKSGFANTEYFRMVLTYWEMVAGLANYGAIDPALVHTTNVEHLRYYAKIEPFLEEARDAFGGNFLPELDKLVKSAPGFEEKLEGWRQLNKSWIVKGIERPAAVLLSKGERMSDKYREIVEKVNDAFATNDIEAFIEVCADNITWTIVGDQTVSGKDNIRELMKSMDCPDLPEFTIDKVISDDNSAAAYGGMTMKEETGGIASYAYCDIYTFDGDEKITELRSFIIKLKS